PRQFLRQFVDMLDLADSEPSFDPAKAMGFELKNPTVDEERIVKGQPPFDPEPGDDKGYPVVSVEFYAMLKALTDAYDRSIARNYDAEYAVIRDPSGDREFYASLAHDTAGPVLELGCGTGRVLMPIAEAGIACVGLDLSASMLEVFRSKNPPSNLELVEGSITDYELGAGRFRLIYGPFRVFQHLCTVEEQLAALACARRHLAPGGLLAFDVFAPLLSRLALVEEPEQEDVRAVQGEDEIRRFTAIWRDHITQVQRVRFRHERWRSGAKIADETTELTMRWFFRFELEHLLARAGFEVVALYGGFDRKPYDAIGEIIVVAKAAEQFRAVGEARAR
ncbi:MAG TPA: methyltransferase domain-containing protein, partial [Polyangiaceae bacterium]